MIIYMLLEQTARLEALSAVLEDTLERPRPTVLQHVILQPAFAERRLAIHLTALPQTHIIATAAARRVGHLVVVVIRLQIDVNLAYMIDQIVRMAGPVAVRPLADDRTVRVL